jgi:hypothetical protein
VLALIAGRPDEDLAEGQKLFGGDSRPLASLWSALHFPSSTSKMRKTAPQALKPVHRLTAVGMSNRVGPKHRQFVPAVTKLKLLTHLSFFSNLRVPHPYPKADFGGLEHLRKS